MYNVTDMLTIPISPGHSPRFSMSRLGVCFLRKCPNISAWVRVCRQYSYFPKNGTPVSHFNLSHIVSSCCGIFLMRLLHRLCYCGDYILLGGDIIFNCCFIIFDWRGIIFSCYFQKGGKWSKSKQWPKQEKLKIEQEAFIRAIALLSFKTISNDYFIHVTLNPIITRILNWQWFSIHYCDDLPLLLSVLPFEKVYLESLPCAEYYEKSYMHRDIISHVAVSK